ncbi:alpha/beta-hydrolase [Thozetella sp. PMI_491]|nr:alpha/beta-hydrolase [Thozetella sp. PMI_491]
MSFLTRVVSEPTETNTTVTVAATIVAIAALMSFLKYSLWPGKPKVIPGPLHTVVAKLPKDELDKLDYKPDAFPGARDVATPYGCIRVYEWGPEDGPKVLMVHGISTSCQTLAIIAHKLVEKGCRVMLFDLFGRGFSDGVGDLPHDARLYTSQALLAMASSPLAWTGDGAIRVIGYSMGGGIAVHFANAFPHMISSLVLLAPAGLIRVENFGVVTRYIFTSGLVPSRILSAITARRLQKPIASDVKRKDANEPQTSPGNSDEPESPIATAATHLLGKTDPVTAALSEAADMHAGAQLVPLEKRVLNYVQWMVKHHEGFIPAFCGSVADAPLIGQEEAWSKLSERAPGTTAVILGGRDEIVDPTDYEKDALPLAGGRENVAWSVIPGAGHDFPMTHAAETLRELYKLWSIEA